MARVHEELDGKPHWLRALAALEVVPHPDLLQQVFGLMSRKGLPPVYVFERRDGAPAEGTLSRIGGRPVGVTTESWPGQDDEGGVAMHHLLTLDLDEVSAMSSLFDDEASALSLYLRAPTLANIWRPHSEGVKVVPLNQDNLDEYSGELPGGYGVHAVSLSVQSASLRRGICPFEPPTQRPASPPCETTSKPHGELRVRPRGLEARDILRRLFVEGALVSPVRSVILDNPGPPEYPAER